MTMDSAVRILNKLYKVVGLPEQIGGAHTLRHTAGTRMYKASGGDILGTARFLGHSDINTSAIYAHYSLEQMRSSTDSMDDD